MATGRTTEGRTITVTTTATSTAITGPAGTYRTSDIGRTITRSGITAGTTITAVASDTTATLSAAATTAATSTATLGDQVPAAMGMAGWSPETDTEANAYTVASNNALVVPPDRVPNAYTAVNQRSRE